MRQQIKRRTDPGLHGWSRSAAPVQAKAQKVESFEGQGFRPAMARHSLGNIAVEEKAGNSESFAGRPNRTGLPDRVKHRVENLSGVSLDDVRVHYNSPKPARVQALAYTQGTEIHLGPGEEKHLAHEAWHAVQQQQGRVRARIRLAGTAVNDDPSLEREADRMGELATREFSGFSQDSPRASSVNPAGTASSTIQRICGAPGCNDPLCDDPANHGFGSVRRLRGRTLYYGDVTPGDVGTGTGTSAATRGYVNAPATNYPQQVAITYATPARTGHSEFINQPLAPGQRADAGHIFGRQFGGLGNDPAAVFPQNPQINRGNNLGGVPTRDLWRAHEDAIRQQAQGGATVSARVTLRETPRADYSQHACRGCGLLLAAPVPPTCPGCNLQNP